MKRTAILFHYIPVCCLMILCNIWIFADSALAVAESRNNNCLVNTLSSESLVLPDSLLFDSSALVVSLSDDVKGFLIRGNKKLVARLLRDTVYSEDESQGSDWESASSSRGQAFSESIELIPANDGRKCVFHPVRPIKKGNWVLEIPDGYFEICPDFIEVADFDFDNEDYENLRVCGAWHKAGDPWHSNGFFSVLDDDCIDGYISASSPSDYMTSGYYSILYPILESLGLRGNISMEGRRVGFTKATPELNDNGKVLLRLQNERGWEILNHSMDCIGEVLNNWVVDSLSSPLAAKILHENPSDYISQNVTSVYDLATRKQYFPLPDNSGWQESPMQYIKPYAGDYKTKKTLLYNSDFDVDYHWGRLFDIASGFGLNVNCYVCYNASSSHAIIPRLNEICPNGFADSSDILYNVPPLKSSVARIGLDGQTMRGYKGSLDPDNKFNQTHYDTYKKLIDECRSRGGWIVLYTHAYRPCWKNYIKGALVSEGGDYPDEWVEPMLGADPVNGSLEPPARLGISNWSEWHPCPGTRCYMIWELLKYARDSGMINVTSSEGFKKFGNIKAKGYFTYGEKIGQNAFNIEGTSRYYPHFVEGANREVYYYNPYFSPSITCRLRCLDVKTPMSRSNFAVSATGLTCRFKSLADLPSGLWIVNGVKILIRR